MFEPVLVAHGREGSVAAVTLNTGLVHYLELETLEQAQGEPQLSCWNRRWTQVTGTAARDPWTRRECFLQRLNKSSKPLSQREQGYSPSSAS
jgi:hypothetical protein